jgi:superfamily I DNA and/or RNA helicase
MDRSLGAPTEVIPVRGASDDPQAKVNRKEAEDVILKLRELINDSRYEGMDFGVCSPFRNQADLIWEFILEKFTDKEIQERKLVSATADGFQGDERDVILIFFPLRTQLQPPDLQFGQWK